MAVRVLINGLHAKSGGGTTYLVNMLPLLAADAELDIHLCIGADQRAAFGYEGVEIHEVFNGGGMWSTALTEQAKVPALARRIGADVVFSPANYGPLNAVNQVLLLRNAPAVAEIERRPAKMLYWRLVERATAMSLRRARRAIAVSDYARRLFANLVPEAAARIEVVPHGVAEIFRVGDESRPRGDFLLAVSDIYIQKNFEVLLRALAEMSDRRPGLRLKIAGRAIDKGHFDNLRALADQLGVAARVDFTGGLGAEELAKLYRECAAFVFPSRVETFGNPLLEAMASGCAIACSDAAAMPEIAGDAALYFPPQDANALTAQIDRLLEDAALGLELGGKARARAAEFSWPNTARRTAEILKASGTSQ